MFEDITTTIVNSNMQFAGIN